MKFEIEVEERVSRINTYVIEVANKHEGESLQYGALPDDIEDAQSLDDVISAIEMAGYEVKEVHYGAEDVEYELQ